MAPVTSNPPESLQRLLDEAPFVRLLARTLLAEEADEVVQRTWLAAVRHGGVGVAEPRSWLTRIARNVAHNLRRARLRREHHEREVAADALVPSSADLLAREEQRRMLVTAVDGLPQALRTVVLLRYFDGLPPRRIAGELGVPVATVWNRLRQALQLLRERLDDEHGGQRHAWLLPLVPFAAGPQGSLWPTPAVPASTFSSLGLGVISMTMKTKLAAAIVVLLALSGALVLWTARDAQPGGDKPPALIAEKSPWALPNLPHAAVVAAAEPDEAGKREALTAPPVPVASAVTDGSLVVHVRYGDDKAPAEGVTMIACRSGADPRVEGLRRITDAVGTARFDGLAAGRLYLTSDRGGARTRSEIRAGLTTEVDFELEVGMTLTGIVVDSSGAPISGAWIEAAPLAQADADAEVLATSGADGHFTIRGARTATLVGARATGYSSSPLQFLFGKDGNAAEIRFELSLPGGTVSGLVLDAQSQPVAGAVVRVGGGSTSGITAGAHGAPPIPAQVRTDGEGCFTAIGVPPGPQPVAVRARGKQPWQESCEVTANLTTPLQIVLADGATLRGTVRNATGDVVAKAEVEIGSWDDFAHFTTLTTPEGQFELTGLPAGEVVVMAQHDDFGKAEQRAQAFAGSASQCDLNLSRGLELQGRVLDEHGAPVAKVSLDFFSMDGKARWSQLARTDAEGRFSVPNCPPGKKLSLLARGFDELRRNDIDPSLGPIELRLRRPVPETVKIRGLIVDPDGKPLPNAMVSARRPDSRSSGEIRATGADGRFELGPLLPGTWTVTARTTLFPIYQSEPRELAMDEDWDLGQIRLIEGGTAFVKVEGNSDDAEFRILDAAMMISTELKQGDGGLVSGPLPPGDHRLIVSGKAVAAQSLPFVVRAGEQTSLNVKLEPGVRQRFEVVAATSAASTDGLVVRVHRGSEQIARSWIAASEGRVGTGEMSLLPGDYRATVVEQGRELASATFTVGATEAAPIRLELR